MNTLLRSLHSPAAVALACALLCSPAYTQEARVRASLASQDSVWVGQQVTLQIELLVPGYFASAVSFDLPDPNGVVLMPPGEPPVMSTETIDGAQYSVQTHEVRAWPMRAGTQAIPAIPIHFRFKRNPLDQDEVPATVTTNAMPLSVHRPPGSENLGTVISARDLQVKETWQPEPGDAAVTAGAAFTRSIEFSASAVPGMLFPPFPAGKIEGLGIYKKQFVMDQDERGTLTGRRQDTITYVCKRPGTFTIPEVRFTWFDLDARVLRIETLPARTLRVIADPAQAAMGTANGRAAAPGAGRSALVSDSPRNWLVGTAGVALLALLLFVCLHRRVRQGLLDAVAPWRAVHLQPLNPTENNTP